MTYKEHVEALIGFGGNNEDIKSSLLLGIKEVISNVLKFNPESGLLFTKESDEQTSNGYKIPSGLLFSVVREDGTDNQWRPARQVNIDKEYLVTDINSMFYASKYNPVFIRHEDNTVNVYPPPSDNNETFKVNYIKFPEFDNNGLTLSSNTDIDLIGIESFPESFHPHLVMYGAIRELNKKYNEFLLSDEDIELSEGVMKSIQQMQGKYVQMFITKDVLMRQSSEVGDAREQAGAPKRRRRRR